ncbi:MAG: hypothetical protein C4539_08960 [Ignavibacteriales bacterium]|nr:MAG: hypothetical protein C4539_08960 [Ignavibacteriales bacterium]
MEEIKNLGLYDLSRSLLLQTETLSAAITKIKNKRLKVVLDEMLKTCQADFFILLDVVSEIEGCTGDLELQELLSTLE